MLEEIKVVYKSPEWYKLRESAIGCSEIGILTGASEWSTPVKIYYQKIGLDKDGLIENERMFHGTQLEHYIMDLWQYWDNKDNFFKNKRDGIVIRQLEQVSDVVYRNSTYPFFIYTPDGKMPPGTKTLLGGILDTAAPVEAKMIDSLLWHKYDYNLPPTYYNQLTGEMIVLAAGYGEFAALVGGNNFNVIPVEMDQVMAEMILECGYKFWHTHVIPGKKLALEYVHAKTDREKDMIWYEIGRCEPPPDSTEAYRKYMSARFLGMGRTIMATPVVDQLMMKREAIFALQKHLEDKKDLISNLLISLHVKESASEIQGVLGKSRYTKKLSVTLNKKPSEEWVKKQISKLDISNYE